MEFLNERPSTDIMFDVDFTDKEYNMLVDYAKRHMPEEELHKAMLNWAIVEALKTFIDLRKDEEPNETATS